MSISAVCLHCSHLRCLYTCFARDCPVLCFFSQQHSQFTLRKIHVFHHTLYGHLTLPWLVVVKTYWHQSCLLSLVSLPSLFPSPHMVKPKKKKKSDTQDECVFPILPTVIFPFIENSLYLFIPTSCQVIFIELLLHSSTLVFD